MSKIKAIGIIAEDNSDFETSKVLIKRIIKKDNITFKKAIGNGCGKVKRKALDYSKDLNKRGCNLLILLHDLDRNNLTTLKSELETKLKGSPIEKYFVCIPIEEIEAWFLSDPNGIREALNLRKAPNIKGQPQQIKSPKEKLEELVSISSNKEKIYLNTKHNEIIATKLCIDTARKKCDSFSKLYDFLLEQKY
jgi:hypothetical protein